MGEEKGVGCSAGVEAGVYVPKSVALSFMSILNPNWRKGSSLL